MDPNGSTEPTTSTMCLMEYYEQENYGIAPYTFRSHTQNKNIKTTTTATKKLGTNTQESWIFSFSHKIKLHWNSVCLLTVCRWKIACVDWWWKLTSRVLINENRILLCSIHWSVLFGRASIAKFVFTIMLRFIDIDNKQNMLNCF